MAVWLTLSVSQGVPNETTRTTAVTATVTVHYSGGSFDGTSPSGTVTIDGQSFSYSCNFNYAGIGQGAASTEPGSVVACVVTAQVPYGESSSRTVSVSASFSRATSSVSQSVALTQIGSGGSSGGGSGDSGEPGNYYYTFVCDIDPALRVAALCSGEVFTGSNTYQYKLTGYANEILQVRFKNEEDAENYSVNVVVTKYTGQKISPESHMDETYICYGGSAYKYGEYTIVAKAIPKAKLHIDGRESFYAYSCHIDNGTGWNAYVPYVDNGVGWDLIS